MPLPRAKLTGLLINELAAVDKGAQGKQPTVVLKSAPAAVTKATFQRVVKQAVLTDEVDGHQHTLDLDDPSDSWCDSYSTSYQTMDGAEYGHSHAWTFDAATGVITIGADSGHTHSVAGVVPPDVLAAAAVAEAAEKQRRAINAASAVLAAEAPGSMAVTVVAQRAAQSNSTPNTPIRSVEKQQEPSMPEITIRKVLASVLTMPETHRAHAATLDGDSQLEFVEKSTADREIIVKAALEADPIVHTMGDGTAIRKSAGPIALSLAKQADAQAKLVTEQATQLEKARVETERVTFEKRADLQLSHFAKALPVRAAIVKAIDGIADEAVRKEAHEALASANAIAKQLGTPHGVTDAQGIDEADPVNAYANLEKGLGEFCKKQNIQKVWTDGLAAFEKTPEGAALKTAYDTATGAQN